MQRQLVHGFVAVLILSLFGISCYNSYLFSQESIRNVMGLTRRVVPRGDTEEAPKNAQAKDDIFHNVNMSLLLDNTINCSRPFVYMSPRGGIGNVLGEATHMLAIRLKYGVQVGLTKNMQEELVSIFPNFPLPPLPQECIDRSNEMVGMVIFDVESYIAENGLDIIIAIGHYPCHAAYFIQYRDLLRFIYRPANRLEAAAKIYREELIGMWREKMTKNAEGNATMLALIQEPPVVVGVHVRRGDYINHMKVVHGSKVTEPIYFDDTFDFARKRWGGLGRLVFIVVSDDRPWCAENILAHHPDAVALNRGVSRDEDLALMAQSDHFISDLGTFGLWGGLLAHGDVIYAANVTYDLTRPYEIEVWTSEAKHENLIPFLYRKPYP